MRKKLLIIDDDTSMSTLLAIMFRNEGYEVQVGNDGVEGLQRAENMHPDLILLDINMPNISGFEVASRIRENKTISETPIFMLTSMTQDSNVEHGYQVGVEDYITKPFNLQNLLLKVKKRLN